MKKNKVLCFMLSLFMMTVCLAMICCGAEKRSDITLEYHLSDCSFEFYRVYGKDVIDEDFKKYRDEISLPENPSSLSADELRTLAVTLDALTEKEGIASDFSAVTDKNGCLEYKNVPEGYYLIKGEPEISDGYLYTPSPIIVSVPLISEDGATTLYDIVIRHTKFSKEPVEELAEVKVAKIWSRDYKKSARPKEITAVLYKDGEAFKEIVLNADNNWEHIWKELPFGCDYKVIEKDVPDGFEMAVEKEDNSFIIKNTYRGESGGNELDEPTDEDSSEEDDTIISTGQLWWPVPLLALMGIVFIMLGIVRRREEKDKQNQD